MLPGLGGKWLIKHWLGSMPMQRQWKDVLRSIIFPMSRNPYLWKLERLCDGLRRLLGVSRMTIND